MRRRQKSNKSAVLVPATSKSPESFAAWVKERIWRRWGVKGLFALWAAAAGAGGLVFTIQQWNEPWVVNLRNRFESPRKIEEIREPISEERAEELGFDISYGWEDRTDYSLLISVTARFADNAYNNQTYLRSISDLGISAAIAKPSESENADTSTSQVVGAATLLNDLASASQLEWIAHLDFHEKPASELKLKFSLGPRSETVLLGSRKWAEQKYRYNATDKSWYRSQGEINFSLSAPDWPIVRSARILKGVAPGTSLLEALVENRGTFPVPLDQLVISARHPRTSTHSCISEDRVQELTLDWATIVTSEEKGASSNLQGVDVRVPSGFRGDGLCSDYSFAAVVPINATAPAQGVTRLQVVVKELPPFRRPTRGATSGLYHRLIPELPIVPEALADWFEVELQINPSAKSVSVFPRTVSIEER